MKRALKNRCEWQVTLLRWPKRPRRLEHRIRGKQERWLSADRRYRVDRYVEGSRRFIAQVLRATQADQPEAWDVIESRRTLAAAQRACQKHLRAEIRLHHRSGQERSSA